MEDRNKQIVEFVDKWIPKFADKKTIHLVAEQIDFGDDCFALKFEMDCGQSFQEKYNCPLEKAMSIADQVDDLDCIASAIFSYWRYFNHWAYFPSEIRDHQDWFIVMLNRLKELAAR